MVVLLPPLAPRGGLQSWSAFGIIFSYHSLHRPVLSPPIRSIAVRRGSVNMTRMMLPIGLEFLSCWHAASFDGVHQRTSQRGHSSNMSTATRIFSWSPSSSPSHHASNSSVNSTSHTPRTYNFRVIQAQVSVRVRELLQRLDADKYSCRGTGKLVFATAQLTPLDAGGRRQAANDISALLPGEVGTLPVVGGALPGVVRRIAEPRPGTTAPPALHLLYL